MLKLVSKGLFIFLLSFSSVKGIKIQTNDGVEFEVIQDVEIKNEKEPDFLDTFFVFESLLKNSETLAKMMQNSSEPVLFLDINSKSLGIINNLNYLLETFSIPTGFENINNGLCCMDKDTFSDHINTITYLALSKKFDDDIAHEFSLKLYPFLYNHQVNPRFFSVIQALRLVEKNNIDFNKGNEEYNCYDSDAYNIKSFKNGLCWAACYGHIDAVNFFLDAGVLIDDHNLIDLTPFDYAALNSQVAIIKLFIERGVSSDLVTRGLCLAIGEASFEMCDLLINAGINVNDVTFTRITPLHKASMSGSLFMIKKLLEMGFRIDCQSRDGYTSLHAMCGPLSCLNNIDNLLLLISESIFDPNRKIKHISSLQNLILYKFGNDAELLLDVFNKRKEFEPKVINNIMLLDVFNKKENLEFKVINNIITHAMYLFPLATLKKLFRLNKDQELSSFIETQFVEFYNHKLYDYCNEIDDEIDDSVSELKEIILRKITHDSTLSLNALNEFENTQMYSFLINLIVENRNLSDIRNLVFECYKVLPNNKHQAELVSALCDRHLKCLQSTISIENYDGKTASDMLKSKKEDKVYKDLSLALFDQISKAEKFENLNGELAKKIRTMYEWRLNPERALTVFQIS